MNRMRFSTSISMMFREHPVDERFAAARQAGFEGVQVTRRIPTLLGTMALHSANRA